MLLSDFCLEDNIIVLGAESCPSMPVLRNPTKGCLVPNSFYFGV